MYLSPVERTHACTQTSQQEQVGEGSPLASPTLSIDTPCGNGSEREKKPVPIGWIHAVLAWVRTLLPDPIYTVDTARWYVHTSCLRRRGDVPQSQEELFYGLLTPHWRYYVVQPARQRVLLARLHPVISAPPPLVVTKNPHPPSLLRVNAHTYTYIRGHLRLAMNKIISVFSALLFSAEVFSLLVAFPGRWMCTLNFVLLLRWEICALPREGHRIKNGMDGSHVRLSKCLNARSPARIVRST